MEKGVRKGAFFCLRRLFLRGEGGLVSNLFYSVDPGRRVVFGRGITAPFGLTTEYSFDRVGRYHVLNEDQFRGSLAGAFL